VALAAVVLCVLAATWGAKRYRDIAALQNCIHRSYEITYNEWGKPSLLPKFIDELANKHFEKRHGSTRGTTNLDTLSLERFRGMFRGRITKLEIHYPTGFNPGIGAALKRFRHVRSLTIGDEGSLLSTADPKVYDELLDAVSKMGQLEQLELTGEWVTDAHVRRLGLLKRLEKLKVGGELSIAIFDTLGSLPALTECDLSYNYFITPEQAKQFAGQHPGIKVTLPDP
jgi:hypothetical protein